MKNVPTQVVRNEDFYPRPKILNKIYRRLESKSHIFLAAPRRVGKTSIMRYLEDHPEGQCCFVYVMLEDVWDVEVFYYDDRIMASLQFDGYIYFIESQKKYQFTSQLLKMWWEKFVLK